MRLAGVADIATDWRLRVLEGQGIDLYAVTSEHAKAMREAGIPIAGTLDDLLGQADVVVDCTPKRVAAQNAEIYRASGLKFTVDGGEKHAVRSAERRVGKERVSTCSSRWSTSHENTKTRNSHYENLKKQYKHNTSL